MFGKKNLLETGNPVERDCVQDSGETTQDFQIEFDSKDEVKVPDNTTVLSPEEVKLNLEEIAQNEAHRKERCIVVERLKSAVAFLNEIDINKDNIGKEMFALNEIIRDMETLQGNILDPELDKRFSLVVKRFQAVLVCGDRSVVAERGFWGHGKVKNREDFSNAINNAIVQAETITWLD